MLRRLSAKRKGVLSNFAPNRLGWRAWAAACTGTALNFPVPGSPAMVRGGDEHVAAGLVVQVNAVFWIICQFDKPNGSARNLGPKREIPPSATV